MVGSPFYIHSANIDNMTPLNWHPTPIWTHLVLFPFFAVMFENVSMVVFQYDPFVRVNHSDSRQVFSGYCLDILKVLADALHFQ